MHGFDAAKGDVAGQDGQRHSKDTIGYSEIINQWVRNLKDRRNKEAIAEKVGPLGASILDNEGMNDRRIDA